MRNHILYQSYYGNEPYIFFRYDKADKQAASGIVNRLIDKQFRTCYDEYDNTRISDSDWLADRMASSDLVVFLISDDSVKNFEFRNSINYALSKKKKMFCIYLNENGIDTGSIMQLSNIPSSHLSDYSDVSELSDDIIKTECFTQEMMGKDAKNKIVNKRKRAIAISTVAIIVFLFFVSATTIAINRINYKNSLAGQIETITITDYLDISNEDASVIELLKDKTIIVLDARNMGLTDIDALQYVNCEELDISENPKINTLEPLLDNPHLKTVKVTQDMYPSIVRISGRHQFKIVISD